MGHCPRKIEPTCLGPVLYGHTYLSRMHATEQCMTMLKGTVEGKKFAKLIHAYSHATPPVKDAPSPSHSMLVWHSGTEREGVRTTQIPQNRLQRIHANIEHRGEGSIISLCVQSEIHIQT